MARVLFIEFHNLSPHIETSFELAKRHLEDGDHVRFVFMGHDVPYREHLFLSKLESQVFRRWMPERRAARLIDHPNLDFAGSANLPNRAPDVSVPLTLEELKSVTYRGADVGMGVASSLISRTLNSQFDPARHQVVVRNALAGCMAVYDYSYDLLHSHQPDLVYLFNGRLCHPRAAMRAAEHLGLKIRVHDRGADMNKFVVREFRLHNRKLVQEEVWATWERVSSSPSSKAVADQWFVERRRGQPRDWHSFTADQQRGLLPSLATGKRIISYFSSSDDEFAAIGDEFRWEGWQNQIDAVENLVSLMREFPENQLIIRIHPHLTQKHPEDLARWLAVGRNNSYVTVLEPGSPIDSYALLDASDVVVTGGSTIGLEAVYWGKPSILLGPSDYDELGAVEIAHSLQALRELLGNPELRADRHSAIPYAYYRATFGEQYRYFEPTGLFGGKFLGENLHRLPHLPHTLHRAKELVLGRVRATRSLAQRSER